MQKEKNDGGPAFPGRVEKFLPVEHEIGDKGERHVSKKIGFWCDGMTLRDWFAGKALQEIITPGFGKMQKESAEHLAYVAYVIADAMLKEREK